MSDLTGPPPPPEPDPTAGQDGRGPVPPGSEPTESEHRDELASALLDGALSPEDAAQAQADPQVAARVAALQHARTQLRDVPPPPPDHADRAIAAALDAVGFDLANPPSPTPSPPPPHLQAVPASPSAPPAGSPSASPSPAPFPSAAARRTSSAPRWLAAAAAIVVVALVAVGVLSRDSDSDSDDQAATTADGRSEEPPLSDSPEAGGGGDAQASDEEGEVGSGQGDASSDAPATTAADDIFHLGEVSRSELIPRVSGSLSDGEGEVPPNELSDRTEQDNPACPGLSVGGDPGRGDAIYVADAILDGSPVRIHVYDEVSRGTLRLVATDNSCSDVVDQSFGR